MIILAFSISAVEGFRQVKHQQSWASRLTQILYAFTSMAGNNGSAVHGLMATRSGTHVGRDDDARPLLHDHSMLAIAGNLEKRKNVARFGRVHSP